MATTETNLRYDDVGAPDGRPVVYLHGTPDSRLARHPDDGLVAEAGVRLLAIDRPGYGGTALSPPGGFAAGVAALLDSLGIGDAAVVAWSGGALEGLRLAGAALDWATSLTIVAGLVPRDAYDDDAVRAGAPGRLSLLEMAEMFPPEDVAAEVATMLAPFPCDRALALEHQREQRAAVDQAVLDSIPGAAERMADALVEAVSNGLAGVQADVVDQVTPFGSAVLARIAVPVHLWYGTDDVVTPPVFGEWYARTLPKADLTLIEGAGHYLPFTHWPELLRNA